MTTFAPDATEGALRTIRGGLVVSCQAPADDPLSGPEIMRRIAQAVVLGGAVAIRAEGIADLEAIRGGVAVPIVGLWKDGDAPVYITPSIAHAEAVAATGVELVAIDATGRARPDGATVLRTIAAIHGAGSGVVADVATYEQGLAAIDAGADAVATTLAGYTADTGSTPSRGGPDIALVEALAAGRDTPVLAEGRYADPADVRRAFDAGAWAVVVGTAITRPQLITRSFVDTAVTRRG
ncbi:MAG: N-acetylmannosamine-6-phosphate 2-epimerase [Nitriliruptoraceae bacterium]|nr:N-acetylmannosamine-6-phosphate 2-epimerase [Nitriliruptoraceae bacterium]